MKFRKLFCRKSESGRGMVEIIGVLAIIGILSITAVTGFKRAMDKTTTNEVLNTLSQRAIIAASQKEAGAEVNLEEFAEDTFTKQYNMTYQDEDDDFFSITMENVPDEVVRNIAAMKWKVPYNIYVNDIQIDDYDFSKKAPKSLKSSFASFLIKQAYAAETGNRVKLYFHKKLEAYDKQPYVDSETCAKTGGAWDGGRCNCHGQDMTESGCKACRPYLKDGVSKCGQGDDKDEDDEDIMCYRDSECRGCLEVCENGKCVLNRDDKCNGEEYCEGTKIVTCTRSGSKDTACASSTQEVKDCTDGGKKAYTCSMESGRAECVSTSEDCEDGQFKDKDGNCVSCDSINSPVNADTTDCETCPNVDVVATAISGGNSERGSFCIPKVSCPAGEFKGANGECLNCDEIKSVYTGGRDFPVKTTTADADITDCESCSNVDIINFYGENICAPKCSSNEFRINKDCVPCSYIRKENGHTQNADATISDCASKCSGVDVVMMYGQKVCTPKCENGEERDKNGMCVKVGCDSGYFKGEDGTCLPCSGIKQEGESATSVDADHTDCASCPNVDVITNGQGNNVCAPKCGSNEFRLEGRTMCTACSEIAQKGSNVTSADANRSDCEKCSNVDVITTNGNKLCVPKCGSEEFRIEGQERCTPCSEILQKGDYVQFASASMSDCEKCPNVEAITRNGVKLCAPKCESGYERDKETGRCEKTSCEPDEFRDELKRCLKCDMITPYNDSDIGFNVEISASSTECASCPNTEVIKGNCYRKVTCASGEFKDENGECVSCDKVTTSGYLKGNSECDTCPSVKVKDGVCVTKCPGGTYGGKDGYPFITEDPYCSSPSSPSCFRARCSDCSDIQSGEYNQAVGTGSTNCATACPNIEVVRIGNAEVCSAKCPSGYERHQSGFCVKEQCDSREFRDESSGACRKCDEIAYNRYAVDTTDCESCPNIEIMTVGAERVCVPKCASNEFRYGNGNCFPCSYIQKDRPYEADISDCEKCPGIDVITQYGYKLCVPKCDTGYTRNGDGECVKTCASGYFKDENGSCISCSKITRARKYSAAKTDCASCPNIDFVTELTTREKFCYRR